MRPARQAACHQLPATRSTLQGAAPGCWGLHSVRWEASSRCSAHLAGPHCPRDASSLENSHKAQTGRTKPRHCCHSVVPNPLVDCACVTFCQHSSGPAVSGRWLPPWHTICSQPFLLFPRPHRYLRHLCATGQACLRAFAPVCPPMCSFLPGAPSLAPQESPAWVPVPPSSPPGDRPFLNACLCGMLPCHPQPLSSLLREARV